MGKTVDIILKMMFLLRSAKIFVDFRKYFFGKIVIATGSQKNLHRIYLFGKNNTFKNHQYFWASQLDQIR